MKTYRAAVTWGESCVINIPELFRDPAFVAWLNDTSKPKFTWHVAGQPTNEYSDVIVLVDPGLEEGSDSEMPGWEDILALVRQQMRPHRSGTHIPVRLTNLSA